MSFFETEAWLSSTGDVPAWHGLEWTRFHGQR